jgi:diguanylate cyclase (GGDEF)-like protein
MGTRTLKRQFSSLRALMQQRSNELAIMMDIGKAITSSLNLEEVLQVIMGKVGTLLEPKLWSLLLLDEESQELYFEIVVSPVADQLKQIRLKVGEGVAGWVAAHGEPLLVAEAQSDPRFSPQIDQLVSFTTKSIICVPLMVKERVFGVIEIINGLEDRSYTEPDLAILATIADFAAIAIDNARTYARINALVITDDLTGLYNARHFDMVLDLEVERAHRYGAPLALVFFDLDHFKQVNDTHGHLVGSRLLAEVGALVHRQIRSTDVAARFGGDEYVILLPSTDKAGALTMVGKLRQRLREHRFHADDGQSISVTASFGIAALPEDALSKLDLMRLADQAMYRVKGTTRDGVELAEAREVDPCADTPAS